MFMESLKQEQWENWLRSDDVNNLYCLVKKVKLKEKPLGCRTA